jgi:hypothetical protein
MNNPTAIRRQRFLFHEHQAALPPFRKDAFFWGMWEIPPINFTEMRGNNPTVAHH